MEVKELKETLDALAKAWEDHKKVNDERLEKLEKDEGVA